MKISLYIFFSLFYYNVFPQNGTSAIVEYKQINNTSRLNSYNCTLFIDGTATIFLPKYLNKANEKKDDKQKEIYPDWEYLKIDHGQNQMIFFGAFGGTKFLVKDDYNNLNWNVSGDNKVIAGYQCLKATTTFRGVDWIAWFTPEITLPYGPWKLHGLPGLIMEVSDATSTYTWRIEKIEYKRSDIFNKDFKRLVETRNHEPLPLKEFLDQQKEFYDNAEAEMEQKYPGAHSQRNPVRTGYEKKYEWEE
jgi:GLPGLI family protein